MDVPLGPVRDATASPDAPAASTRPTIGDSAAALMSSMIAHAPTAQIVCRANGRIVAVNDAARLLFNPVHLKAPCPLWLKNGEAESPTSLTKRLHKIASGAGVKQLSLDLPSGVWTFRAWPIEALDGQGTRMLMLSMDEPQFEPPRPVEPGKDGVADDSAWRRLGELEKDRRRLRREAQRLQRLCQTDPLTGVLNRSGFARAVRKALLVPEAEGTLYFVDLDRFKAVNDHLGHATGDSVLRHVARAMRRLVRSDDAIARLGGDEFAMWCVGGPRSDLCPELIADTIEEACRSLLSKHAVGPISASVGAACAPHDAQGYSALLRIADARMYHDKEATQARRP